MDQEDLLLSLLTALLATAPAIGHNRPRVTRDDLLALNDLSNSQVDLDGLHSPGAPQDGIPRLSEPKLARAAEADFPPGDARVAVVKSLTKSSPIPC